MSSLLKPQAPVKADILRLRCKKEELIEINNNLGEMFEK